MCACLQDGQEHEVDALLRRKFENRFMDIEIVEREDLDLVRLHSYGPFEKDV